MSTDVKRYFFDAELEKLQYEYMTHFKQKMRPKCP